MKSFSQRLRRANIARDREMTGGAGNVFSLSFRGNELAGETGEACNILKKLDREKLGIVGSRATKEQLIEELSDIIICVDLICMDLGIKPKQMEKGVRRKFNKTSKERKLKTQL